MKMFLAAIISLFLACFASAQCRTIRTVSSVNSGPVVVQSVPCGTSFHTPVVNSYSDYQRVVAVPVQVQPDYIFTVNDVLRDRMIADAVVGKLAPILLQQQQNQAALQEQIRLLSGGNIAPIPNENQNLTVKKPEPKTIPKASVQDEAIAFQPSAEVQKIFSDRCTRCHGDNGIVKGGFNMSGKLSLSDWQSIYITSNTGEMPKDDKALTDDEMKLILRDYRAAKASTRK